MIMFKHIPCVSSIFFSNRLWVSSSIISQGHWLHELQQLFTYWLKFVHLLDPDVTVINLIQEFFGWCKMFKEKDNEFDVQNLSTVFQLNHLLSLTPINILVWKYCDKECTFPMIFWSLDLKSWNQVKRPSIRVVWEMSWC